MNNTFLPLDFQMPADNSGKYMKLQQGENRFRVLDSAITGWEYWTEDNGKRTPHRVKDKTVIPMSEFNRADGKVKHFWAFPVYNYDAKEIQILSLNQKTIMQAITMLVKNPKWGDPKHYDIVIHKTGQQLETSYTVSPDPKEPIDAGVEQAYKDMHINLEALWTNGDPFEPKEEDFSDLYL